MPLTQPDPTTVSDALRLLVGATGALSLLFGARLYKPALFGASFSAGAIGVVAAASRLPAELRDPVAVAVAACIVGVAVAIAAGLAHKVALVAIGAVVGAVSSLSLGAVVALPVWAPLIGAVIGALVFPWTLKPLLKLATPAVGAALLAWALDQVDQPLVLVGLYVLGVVFQMATGGKAAAKDES